VLACYGRTTSALTWGWRQTCTIMKFRSGIALTVGSLLLGLAAITLFAQDSDPREGKLLVLERMWNEAQVNRDAAALEQLVSSRFVNTEYDGIVSDKQTFLADVKDPLYRPSIATIQDVKMNFFGDTAVVTGTYHTAGTYQGKPYDHVGRFTDTWIFEVGRWQCVASHTSLVKK
jgi:ketosteroid isomerase-like protein